MFVEFKESNRDSATLILANGIEIGYIFYNADYDTERVFAPGYPIHEMEMFGFEAIKTYVKEQLAA